MMKESQVIEMVGAAPTRRGWVRDWQRWAPSAAVAWSLIYAALGIYWAVGGAGFPFTSASAADALGPLLGRFGPVAAWTVVLLAGIPAAAMGAAMLRGARKGALRPLLITAGTLLAGVLLLLMTSLDLLVKLGYLPYAVISLFKGADFGQTYLKSLTQWATLHQVLCLAGGFLWLAATVCYARRSADACVYCGRRDGAEGWQGPNQAARWGRVAVYVAMVAPIFYAFVRYAWALGIPLGMSEEYLRQGQDEWDVDLGTLPGDLRPGGGRAYARVGAVLGRGIPALDDRPGRAAGAHRGGGNPGRARSGAAGGGRHRDLVRPGADGRQPGGQRGKGHGNRRGSHLPARTHAAVPGLGAGAGGGSAGVLLPAARPVRGVRSLANCPNPLKT